MVVKLFFAETRNKDLKPPHVGQFSLPFLHVLLYKSTKHGWNNILELRAYVERVWHQYVSPGASAPERKCAKLWKWNSVSKVKELLPDLDLIFSWLRHAIFRSNTFLYKQPTFRHRASDLHNQCCTGSPFFIPVRSKLIN